MAADEPVPSKRRENPPPIEFMKPGEAQAPPPARDQTPAAWVPSPEEFQRRRPPWQPATPPARGPGRISRFAGGALILAGVFGIAWTVYSALNLPTVAQYANFTLNNTADVVAFSQICGLITIWADVAALLGGIMALQRMNWRLTLVCAVLAPLAIGFIFEASFLGVLGLLLVILGRNEFSS